MIFLECLDDLNKAGCEEVVKKCLHTCGGCANEDDENDDDTTKMTTIKPTVFPTTTRSSSLPNSTSLPGVGREDDFF